MMKGYDTMKIKKTVLLIALFNLGVLFSGVIEWCSTQGSEFYPEENKTETQISGHHTVHNPQFLVNYSSSGHALSGANSSTLIPIFQVSSEKDIPCEVSSSLLKDPIPKEKQTSYEASQKKEDVLDLILEAYKPKPKGQKIKVDVLDEIIEAYESKLTGKRKPGKSKL
jgi:hypothetical protein